MALLPDIMPADPRDPESVRYRMKPLRHGLLGRLFMAFEVARERRDLRDLDDTLLRDIGLTRDAANREATRGFWDIGTRGAASVRNDLDACLSRPATH